MLRTVVVPWVDVDRRRLAVPRFLQESAVLSLSTSRGVRSGEMLLLQLKLKVRPVLLVEVLVNLLCEFIELVGPTFEN
jgi:hypothetical protein